MEARRLFVFGRVVFVVVVVVIFVVVVVSLSGRGRFRRVGGAVLMDSLNASDQMSRLTTAEVVRGCSRGSRWSTHARLFD